MTGGESIADVADVLAGDRQERLEAMVEHLESLGERPALDPFDDDAPLECGLEDPEECEVCQ